MGRLHGIEIAETSWCPRALREGVTDYLAFMIERSKPYAPAEPLLEDALRRSGATEVVDLGAGGGGPWSWLAPRLRERGLPIRVRLTDLHPNLAAYSRIAEETGSVVTGESTPVRADQVPAGLTGFRTIFSAFHHFEPAVARAVLADAAAHGRGMAVFEATRRDLVAVLLTCLTPIFALLAAPFIRPFRWSRVLLTYLPPLIPLVILFDGIVSCLRTYTPPELLELARSADSGQLSWTAGEVGPGPIPMSYLVGVPIDRTSDLPSPQRG